MVEFSKEDINIGGSVFWILMIFTSLLGLSYMMLWSFHNNSIKGAIISFTFFAMIISGVLLSRSKVFDMNSWSDNALSLTLGFWGWFILGKIFAPASQSTLGLGMPKNYLFASISSELPIFTEMIMNNFIVPISEELFWMIGMPFALITIMENLGKVEDFNFFGLFNMNLEWLKNPILQMIIVILICSSTFAIFHIGKLFIGFIISAIIFRTIMIVMVIGDYKFDLLKGINLVAGFSIGSHIANNILDTGLSKTWIILKTNIPVTIIIMMIFFFIFLSALNRIFLFFIGKDDNLIGDD